MEHSTPQIYTEFLPISRADMEARGWEQLDFVVVGGDAYVDHPSFGTAIISRLLEAEGYKVGVLAQPRYTDCEDFKRKQQKIENMAKNYPDYDTLREQYEAGNISAVDFVTQQSDEVSEDYERFCNDEGISPDKDSSALAFMDFREELFEESVSN